MNGMSFGDILVWLMLAGLVYAAYWLWKNEGRDGFYGIFGGAP